MLIGAAAAHATDYYVGQCPVSPNCFLGAYQAENATTYSDTSTFVLGDWQESYGVYEYTSSHAVVVSGENTVTPCSGRGGCRGTRVTVTITYAEIDGIAMTHTTTSSSYGPIDHWTYSGSLAAGEHRLTVKGNVVGATSWGRWSGQVQGLTYSLATTP